MNKTFIEVFAGCGGLSLGLSQSGYKPILLVDNDKNCIETLKLNHDISIVKHIDVTQLNLSPYKGIVNLLAGGILRRLAMDKPCLTLLCTPSQKQTERCFPTETRPLNIIEYARIQTFPDSYKFYGSLSSRYKQIGNAVPVNLAFHIGKALIRE